MCDACASLGEMTTRVLRAFQCPRVHGGVMVKTRAHRQFLFRWFGPGWVVGSSGRCWASFMFYVCFFGSPSWVCMWHWAFSLSSIILLEGKKKKPVFTLKVNEIWNLG